MCKNCKNKRKCYEWCDEFVQADCEHGHAKSRVFNGCPDQYTCKLEKRLYDALKADKEYKDGIKGKREGYDLTDEEIALIDKIVTPLIKTDIQFTMYCKWRVTISRAPNLHFTGLSKIRNLR